MNKVTMVARIHLMSLARQHELPLTKADLAIATVSVQSVTVVINKLSGVTSIISEKG